MKWKVPDVAARLRRRPVREDGLVARSGNKADFFPAAVTECGVGIFVWSTVMAYDGDKLKSAPKDLG